MWEDATGSEGAGAYPTPAVNRQEAGKDLYSIAGLTQRHKHLHTLTPSGNTHNKTPQTDTISRVLL